uniref:Poly(A) RNA polymerase cid14 n=1 Tax=Noccaea caerulescens TaxID=107243 RepID=A0A1J3FX79_NOCCA
MGEHESWAASPPSPSGLFPNGLLPGKAASVTRPLDAERWAKAEDRTAELIACIQPNPPSEDRRNAVARYVRRLIMECFPRQIEIFTFGSVPLKTYLPDGDIDLTAFSTNQNLKDSWANLVRDVLEKEEKNENAEFHVKEVQYIQAEVKIIKCLVENIVVDISFNQIGGLCTLCFLEEVDQFINQNHLFKRSIILIKAWCYYESRILGAHHGLISTYALETLVLYIFHVFNNSFSGPLEVLYRFLEFFSKFDWQNFCISLWGPVPISSLPDVTAEPPRKDVGELRASERFLKACSRVYAVNPVAQEIQGQPFVSKHFNVIDPLRENNNLGRSVSKGNFFRIRSAFTLGAKKLARLLECPKENLIHEVNQFFMNTWERHGSGRRPDAPGLDLWLSRLGDPEPYHQAENVSNSSSNKKSHNSASVGGVQGARSIPSQQNNCGTEVISRATYQTQKSSGNSYQPAQEVSSNKNASNDKLQQTVKPEFMVNNIHGKHLFARTRSSPELTETYGEAVLQLRRSRAPEAGKRQTNSVRADSTRKKTLESENLSSNIRYVADSTSIRHTPSPRSPDSTADMSSAVNSYYDDIGSVSVNEDFSAAGDQGMQQEEQDLVNSMTTVTGQGFNGQFPFPYNFATGHSPFPITPSILASMGYGQRNGPGIVPPFIETPWSTNMQFPQNFASSPFTHYFPSGSHINLEKLSKTGNEDMGSPDLNVDESDHELWHEQERGPHNFGLENGGYGMHHANDKHQSSSAEHSFVPSSRKIRSTRGDDLEKSHSPVRGGSQNQSEERNAGSRSVSCASSVRSRTSSESSWDGSTTRSSKPCRDRRNKKVVSGGASALYGKGKSVPEHSIQVEDDNREWIPVSSQEITERDLGPRPTVASFQLQRHQIHGHELAQASGSESTVSLAPFILGNGMQQNEVDNSGYTFYPTGPPVPIVAMLPMYNYQVGGNAASDTLASHLSVDEGVENHDPCKTFNSFKGLDQSEIVVSSHSTRVGSSVEPTEHKNDILNGDFTSHWQNLQYGRSCQNSQHPPVLYPTPVVVPPAYLQGRVPWDGPGRPLAYASIMNQLMNYGPRLVPLAPAQPVSPRPPNIYPRYGNETPRYRSGTGTYFPNPKISPREQRPSSGMRRGNYGHDRNEHYSDREGNWNNAGTKTRGSGRGHNNRNQADNKSSPRQDRSDRHWGSSYRHESSSYSSHHSQNGPTSQDAPGNISYGMYRLPPGMKQNHMTSSEGHNAPSVMMLYPYDHNTYYSSPTEHVEFGSLGLAGEAPHQNDGNLSAGGAFEDQSRFRGAHMSSPDGPSSPRFPRGK